MADVKKILGNIALPDLARLIYNLDSEGPAIKIVNKNDHRIFEVLHDSETIQLDSEGRLFIPLDGQTVFYDASEGLIKATGLTVSEGDAIRIDREMINGVPQATVNVMFDSESIVLDSEGRLSVPFDKETIIVNSEGLIQVNFDEKTLIFENGVLETRIGGWREDPVDQQMFDVVVPTLPADGVVKIEGYSVKPEAGDVVEVSASINLGGTPISETKSFTMVSSGDWLEASDPSGNIIDGIRFKKDYTELQLIVDPGKVAIGSDLEATGHGLTYVYHKVDAKYLGTDNETIYVNDDANLEVIYRVDEMRGARFNDSEKKIYVAVDGETIGYDSEGRLCGTKKLEAILPVVITSEGDSEGEQKIKLLYADALGVNSEGQLFTKVDGLTIKINSEGELATALEAGEANEIIISEGVPVLNVLYDDVTIHLNSENQLELHLDDMKALEVDSEGKLFVKADGLTIQYNSAGELVAFPEPLFDGIATHVVYGTSEWDSESIDVLFNEDKGLQVNSENELEVKVDDLTIKFNSAGELVAFPEPLFDGVATHVVYGTSEWDSESINVLFNEDKGLQVNSENELEVKVDGDTVRFNSEGQLEAKTILEGEANHIYDSEGNLKIDVLYDDVTIHLNSENKLELHPDETRAFAVDEISGELFVKADEKSVFYNSEGQLEIKVDEMRALEITSEGKVAVKVDDLTVKFDSEGRLFAIPEPLKDGIATHVVPATEAWDSEAIDVLYNKEAGLRVNSENELEVIIDSEGLEFTSEGAIRLVFDHRTIVFDADSEGKVELRVPIDEETIRLNSEGKLSADALPKPYIGDSFLYIPETSEGIGEPEWHEAKINGVSLAGDHNTEEAKIIWWGTSEEYAAIEAAGELNDYTLYILNDNSPIVPEEKNYNDLSNKPLINGVTLSGNKTLASFGIQPAISSGVATVLANNKIDLSYEPGVLTVDTSNRLTADTYTTEQIDNMLASLRTVKYAATKPTSPSRNTLYYVGSTSPYQIYLYDSYGTEINLGTSAVQTYSAGSGISINSSNVISANVNTTLTEGTSSALPPTSQAVVNYAEHKTNKVTSLAATATNDQYPSAKVVYDTFQTKVGAVAPSDSSLEILSGTTLTHKEPATLGGAGVVGSQTIIPKITYDKFGHIQKTEQVTVYPPTTAGLAGQVWVSDGAEAGEWLSLADLMKVKYESDSKSASDSTTFVLNGPAPDTGYKRLCCVGAYISSNVPNVNWSVTQISDAQVTIYANGWSGTQTLTANSVWLYVRESTV